MDGVNTGGIKCRKRYGKEIKLFSIILIFINIIMVFNIINNTVYAETYSSSVTIEKTSKKIINGTNEHVKLPMASTTKVMTAYLACISGKLDETVTIQKEAVGIEGSSIYLKVDEKISLRDLTYGLMMQSGNDSAVAIAIFLGSTVENFAVLMNEKAKELGAVNTNFCNPHGLHDDNHFTTAYDLALITAFALENNDFKTIVSTKNYTIKSEDNVRYIKNKNKMLNMYPDSTGVKTGYTKKAGRCLVSSAEKNGVELISVVLNHGDMWNDSINNLNNGFNECKEIFLARKDEVIERVRIPKSEELLDITLNKDIKYIIFRNDKYEFNYEIVFDKNIKLPIKSGDKIGNIQIYDGKRLIFSENIYSINDIEGKGESSLKKIAGQWTNWIWRK